MSDNIVDIDSIRNKQSENSEHEDVCNHCVWQDSIVADFIDSIKELDVTSDTYKEEVRELIDYVEYVTRKQTLLGIAGDIMAEVDCDEHFED